MAGSLPGSNSTSTTGPMTWTIFPVLMPPLLASALPHRPLQRHRSELVVDQMDLVHLALEVLGDEQIGELARVRVREAVPEAEHVALDGIRTTPIEVAGLAADHDQGQRGSV